MIKAFKELYRMLDPRQQKFIFILGLMLTVMAFLEVVGVASIMPFLALVGDPSIISENKWLARSFELTGLQDSNTFVVYCGIFAVCMLVFSNMVRFFTTAALLKFIHGGNFAISTSMFKIYILQPYTFFLNHNSSEMGKNILDEVGLVSANVLQQYLILASRGIITLAMLTFMVAMEPLVSVALFSFFGGCYVIAYLATHRKMSSVAKLRVKAQSGRFHVAGDSFRGIKEVKSGNREMFFFELFRKNARDFAHQCAVNEIVACCPRFILEVVAFGSVIILVLYFFIAGFELAQFLPLLGMYALGGMKLMPALQQMFTAVNSIRFYLPTLQMLYRDFSKYGPSMEEAESAVDAVPFEKSIRFRDVSFVYPKGERNVLDSLELVINKNEMVGLVGTTGAGKTTLIDILLGLLRPDEGTLEIDGVPVDSKNVRAWQKHIGYVSQSIFLLDDTVRMNIAFGVEPEDIDDEKVLKAAKIANIHDHIMENMPDGYNSIVGEQGVRMSGGQKQRMGIARALYHDPDVLILDEATSALDSETESRVMDSIKSLAGKKTIIMIAHRTQTLSQCDRIFMLDQGRVVSSGKYVDFVNQGAELFRDGRRESVSGASPEGCTHNNVTEKPDVQPEGR